MSVKVTGWVWDQPLPTSEKIVLLKLADHAHHDGSNVYPSVAEIAKDTGLSERQVQRYLSAFVRRGVLAIDGNLAGGRGRTRVYRFTFELGEKGDTGVTDSEEQRATPTSPIPGENGDMGVTVPGSERVTPVTGKGDTGDMKRVTPVTEKGDIHARANQNRPEPSPEPSGNRGGGARSTPHQLPTDFLITDEMYRWADEEFGLPRAEVDRETDTFRDHFAARGDHRVDWVAEWRKWIRRGDRFRMNDPIPLARTRDRSWLDTPDRSEPFDFLEGLNRKGT